MTVATDHADLVLTGGHVHTVDRAHPRAEAVAVSGGRISAAGSTEDVRPLIGPNTRVVDLRGRLLLPGFGDAHCHPLQAGIERFRCNLEGARGREDVLATIAHYAAEHPDEQWIVGGGWYMADFPGGTPTREDLDAIVPDRPVFLVNRDGHGAWANSTALAMARIDADTADPADGRIERRPDREPSGTLHEGAQSLVEDLIPKSTPAERGRGLLRGQSELHALGITNWQDAIVTADDLETYRSAAEAGTLTARVVAALWWERSRGLEQIDDLVALRDRTPVGRLVGASVKIMLDGVLENYTGSLLSPYLDAEGRPTTNQGKRFVEPSVLGPAVTRLDALGFQVHLHAIGDRAVRDGLDAIETARRAHGPNDHRHHIAHIQVIHPDDVPRFGRLGVVANMQPYWATHEDQMDVLTIPFLGPRRTMWQYPFASLERTGATLAGGSDWSVSTANPLLEIEVAVNRVGDDRRGSEPFLPKERLSLESAVRAFTLGTAFVNHLDGIAGSIEVGKAADLTVIDRDIFALDAGPIGDARVLATFVEGGPVFEDPSLGS
jgi:predicted amidohydrolase YtcJ